MSNFSTTIDARGAIETTDRPATKGFWTRFYEALVAAREEQARRQIAAYINGLSEEQRKDLGYPTGTDLR